MNQTLEYYEKHAELFVKGTVDIDFSETQDFFLSRLEAGASILDFGCGSGRDARYFRQKGYKVAALDGCAELCRLAEENSGITVRQMDFRDFDEQDRYDGIWACASILHLPKDELKEVLRHLERALHKDGILYTSFKYGEFSGTRKERHFTDFTEETFRAFLSDLEELWIETLWITTDARPGREDEKWLNLLLRSKRCLQKSGGQL